MRRFFYRSNIRTTASTVSTLMACLALLPFGAGFAQDPVQGQSAIGAAADSPSDQQIFDRIVDIYSQFDTLSNIDVSVQGGVVVLAGKTSNTTQAQRAVNLAARVNGVVTVEDNIERALDVQGNLVPIVDQLKQDLGRWARASPLLLLALVVFVVIAYAGHALAKWSSLWRRIAPNVFLAELITQAVRVAAFILALVVALSLIGATTLMGTILGGAGLLGLAVGFAVRDTMENYISSIMLSLKQPFRANEHVVINEHEGKVIRLTSRATVLMTLDGNHLRIPNATVYKAVILNYTRNPERRFDFELGVDADDDPLAAMKTGIDAIAALDFILSDPKPDALIKAVGDSNILITFTAWISQDRSEFQKARSLAIRAAKLALEAHGFTLPEPIYRLRFDGRGPQLLDGLSSSRDEHAAPEEKADAIQASRTAATDSQALVVRPNRFLEAKVNDERRMAPEADLLDGDRPVE
jgi:small-conductance mechanosensitive channel